MGNINSQEYEYLLIQLPQILLDKDGNLKDIEDLFAYDYKITPDEIAEYLDNNLLKNLIEVDGLIEGIKNYRTAIGMFPGLEEKLLVLQLPSNSFPNKNRLNSMPLKPIITKINYGPNGNEENFEITKSLIHGVLLANGRYVENPNYTTDYNHEGMLQMPLFNSQKSRRPR